MEIYSSFEARFKPFPSSNRAVDEFEDFMDEMAEILYGPEFEFDCSLACSSGIFEFATDSDVNPKEFIPALADAIAKCGGQGDITGHYITTVMEIPGSA